MVSIRQHRIYPTDLQNFEPSVLDSILDVAVAASGNLLATRFLFGVVGGFGRFRLNWSSRRSASPQLTTLRLG